MTDTLRKPPRYQSAGIGVAVGLAIGVGYSRRPKPQ